MKIFREIFSLFLLVVVLIVLGILVDFLLVDNNTREKETIFSKIEEKQSKTTYQLDRSVIISLTNQEREQYGLPLLEESEKLDQAATKKVNDMFYQQYFAHTSPTGEEAKDLVADLNYEYILVGENLAKGFFEEEIDLVKGWMNSPKHRENILEEGYKEIGVGVQKGIYEDEEVWIAVQIFGTPADICSYPDETLLVKIEDKEVQLENLRQLIDLYDNQIKAVHPSRGEKYNALVEERNAIADDFNATRSALQELVAEYNLQVEERNNCLQNY